MNFEIYLLMGNYDAMMEYSKNLMMDPVMGVMGNIYPKF